MSAGEYLSVSETAKLIGANPRDISTAFYLRKLRDDIAPVIAGRRCIPTYYLPTIQQVLRRDGKTTGGLTTLA